MSLSRLAAIIIGIVVVVLIVATIGASFILSGGSNHFDQKDPRPTPIVSPS